MEPERGSVKSGPALPAQPLYPPHPAFTPPAPSLTHSGPPHPSRPLWPAYAKGGAYVRQPPSLPEMRQPQGLGAVSVYIPIDQDDLFELDHPIAGERCFLLPKEGDPLVECQDRYALDAERGCYAVADGVAASFVPGPWARIVARSFVQHADAFATQDTFYQWLSNCSNEWRSWIEGRWVPTMNALRESNGDRHGDWSNDINQGSQTTLIGCCLQPVADSQEHATSVSVFAIGDAEFFLFRRTLRGEWAMMHAFPYSDPGDFGSHPDTLVTIQRQDLFDHAWMQKKTKLILAYPGDLIVLATDTLAKWLLTQVQQKTDRWVPLLTNRSPDEFERRMRIELHYERIEDDDLTMLIIPVTEPRGKANI
jgi:hypothetical protein